LLILLKKNIKNVDFLQEYVGKSNYMPNIYELCTLKMRIRIVLTYRVKKTTILKKNNRTCEDIILLKNNTLKQHTHWGVKIVKVFASATQLFSHVRFFPFHK